VGPRVVEQGGARRGRRVEVEERRARVVLAPLTPGDTLRRAAGASPATKIRQGYAFLFPLPSHPAAVIGCICIRI
jgi:hypothetical protein